MRKPDQFLSISSLVLLQIVLVANLQTLPANAAYGLSLPLLYCLAGLGFFLPCLMMVSQLATQYPQTGGAFIWAEAAFGKKWGFFCVALLWVSNLLWYPSLFSFIASNAAYVISPNLATHKLFILGFALLLFWGVTLLNCFGVNLSTKLSTLSACLGIIFPLLLIIACSFYWYLSGKPLALSSEKTPWLIDFSHLDNWGLFIAVVICFFGVEIPAVHAGNVINPRKNFSKSIWIAAAFVFCLTLFGALAIASIVPHEKLNLLTGLLDAIDIFFTVFHWQALLSVLFFIILIGNIGSAMAWMLGSTRGMFIACQHNRLAPFLCWTNRREAPIGVLVFEALLFTLFCCAFLVFPNIVDSFWLLLVLASQLTLIYYLLLFLSAIKLNQKSSVLFFGAMLIGTLTALSALFFGFIPPNDLTTTAAKQLFQCILGVGLVICLLLPSALLRWRAS